ncbi:MAG: tetratricopeptide repeat protein, partial [Planctomycetaceae bacterium]
MSYIKVGSRFVIAVLVLLSADCVLAGQEQTSVAGGRRTIEQLRRLLSSRTSRVPVQKALSAYPKLNGKQGSYSVDRNGKTEVKQTRMRTRVADADHLILQYDNVDGDRVGEVITFSQKEKLYRRWQVVDDQLVGEWVGIGDGDASVATDNRTRTNTISWTPLVESAIAMSAAGCISTDSITLDRFSGDIKFVRSTVKIVAGELQTREALTVRSPIGNFSDFEEPYQRLQAAKKKSKGSLWERITGKKKGTEYKFEEKNFVFQPPSPDYLEVDFSRINPAVTLGLRHRARGQHLLVIAERVEMLTVTKKAYSEVVRKLARSALPGATLTANSEREVNGLQFTTFATAVDKKTTRFYSTTTFGNYAYQIVTLTPNPAMAAGLEFHLNVLNGFELIDKSRSETPFLELDKPHFGLRTNVAALQDVGAQKAPADEDAGTEPILDLQFADGSILTAHAIDLEGVEIEDDNAIAILSNELGLKYPDNVIKSRPLRMGTANGSEVTFVVEFLSGERGTYMVRFLRNDEHLVMLATSIEAETGSHEKILHERLDAFEFYKPKPRANRKLSEKNAELVNVLGVQLYRMGQAAKSLALVKLACDRRPDNVVFRTNYVMMLQNSGESQAALDEIERALKRFPNEQKLLAAKTESLNALRKYDQALAVYEQLLKSKTFTEGDLYGYANTLLQVGRANDAVAAYETYLPRLDRPSINLRRGYCSMLQFAERFDDAIKLAEELQQEMPNSIELKEDLILAFVEARRAPDALSAAGKLIRAGQATANCLYLQGRAYLVERRFDKAKQSFEAGLKLAPGDSILQDAILSASAAMGEGDNSSIKEPLKPVEIPSIVQQKIESLPAFQPNDGFNYQFIERTSGIEFRKDQPVRRTEYNECLVHNQAGVDALQKLRFLFDPTYQQIYVNELQVIDESGNVTDQRNVSQFYVTSASQYGMATTEKYLNVPVSGLKPGHRLRYVFTKSDRLPSDSIPFTDTPFLASSPAGPRCVFVTG